MGGAVCECGAYAPWPCVEGKPCPMYPNPKPEKAEVLMTPNSIVSIDQLIRTGKKMYVRHGDSSYQKWNLALVHLITEASGLDLSNADKIRKLLEAK